MPAQCPRRHFVEIRKCQPCVSRPTRNRSPGPFSPLGTQIALTIADRGDVVEIRFEILWAPVGTAPPILDHHAGTSRRSASSFQNFGSCAAQEEANPSEIVADADYSKSGEITP